MFKFLSNVLPYYVTQNLTGAYFKVSAWRSIGCGHSPHSHQGLIQGAKIKIRILPALSDNYMYLIIDKVSKEAAVVDPIDSKSVLNAVREERAKLTKVLTTHHHWDHAGGNDDLVSKVKKPLLVFGGDERIAALTNTVEDGDCFKIGNITVHCLSTPSHTSGHMCYYVTIPDDVPALFTGDTLHVAGCGRFVEGTAIDMYITVKKFSKLPGITRVFCGHEYTLQNLKFAKYVEENNAAVINKILWAIERRSLKEPTVPSTIDDEKRINPFMRVDCASVKKFARCTDSILTMEIIRKIMNNFE